MKAIFEYELENTHSLDYAEYQLHCKSSSMYDYFMYLAGVLTADTCSDTTKVEKIRQGFDELRIYNDLIAYKLSINQSIKDRLNTNHVSS